MMDDPDGYLPIFSGKPTGPRSIFSGKVAIIEMPPPGNRSTIIGLYSATMGDIYAYLT